ncbi:hypothetical protein C1H76_3813 [Elsinoe australis]|uniref:Uncharacterized protein n=1 Tax=Elsinoe australis TaxID=40998 RepID=A0A4U7B2H6_9PEZI|nr:hypothetical protein C1H76_3813 [Elsinoe australis]
MASDYCRHRQALVASLGKYPFPVATRNDKKDVVPTIDPNDDIVVVASLKSDLCVQRITNIESWLWVCGRLLPPRALNTQAVLRREIVPSEDVELHMLWTSGKIFIKPLPFYFRSEDFRKYMYNSKEPWSFDGRGLLYSYTALLAHPYDLKLAIDIGLMCPKMEWEEWQDIVTEFMKQHPYPDVFQSISPRYHYGELRLSRLDKIYRWGKGNLLRGYSNLTGNTRWADFFSDNFGKIAAVLFYVTIVLTAMQVGLATDTLGLDQAFQRASYGFTVFAILGPLAGIGMIIVVFLFMFIANWIRTTADYTRRMKAMNLPPPGKRRRSDKTGTSKV